MAFIAGLSPPSASWRGPEREGLCRRVWLCLQPFLGHSVPSAQLGPAVAACLAARALRVPVPKARELPAAGRVWESVSVGVRARPCRCCTSNGVSRLVTRGRALLWGRASCGTWLQGGTPGGRAGTAPRLLVSNTQCSLRVVVAQIHLPAAGGRVSVVTAMPSKHVSLWSVREGGRAFPPQRRAVGCVLLPARAGSWCWQGASRGALNWRLHPVHPCCMLECNLWSEYGAWGGGKLLTTLFSLPLAPTKNLRRSSFPLSG